MPTLLELVTNPKHPVEAHLTLSGETPKAPIAGEQGPLPPLGDCECEGVGSGKVLPFAAQRGGAGQFDRCELLNLQSERDEPVP